MAKHLARVFRKNPLDGIDGHDAQPRRVGPRPQDELLFAVRETCLLLQVRGSLPKVVMFLCKKSIRHDTGTK